MAGIGFELRRLMESGTYFGVARAYGVAGIVSAGPWVLSILGILAISLFRTGSRLVGAGTQEFLVSVTYLTVFSFLLTSPLQLPFTRFVGDRSFRNRESDVGPNLMGLLLVAFGGAGLIGAVGVSFLDDAPLLYRLEMLAGLVLLSGVWPIMAVLSSVQDYSKIMLAFAVGYGVSVVAAYAFREYGLIGYLGGYLLGQSVLLFYLLALVLRRFPSAEVIAFDFLRPGIFHPKMAITGFLLGLGVWVDKFLFWIDPATGTTVIAPLRASEVYDLPVFLAYISIIPGMASLLIRIETDFSDKYARFYASLDEGASLSQIFELRDAMTLAIRRTLHEIEKVQAIVAILFIASSGALLKGFGLSPLYQPLVSQAVVGVSIQVVLLGVFSLLSYLDLQAIMVKVSLLLVFANTLFTLVSLALGPSFYGYGFTGAMIITVLVGLSMLSRSLDDLLYRTYMLQRVSI